MKIGIRATPRTSGGGAVFAEQLVRALNQHPDVDGVTTFLLDHDGHDLQPGQVSAPVNGGAVARWIKGRQALARAIKTNPVDVLLCPGNEVTSLPGVPTIMWPLTVAPFEDATMARLGRSVKTSIRWQALRESIRRNAGNADGLVFSSHYARALYRDNVAAIRDRPSTVIHPGPSVKLDGEDSQESAVTGPYILIVSHLYPYKMVIEAIEGFARAVELTRTSHELLIAGNAVDPAYLTRIKDAIQRHGVSDRVRLLGGVVSEDLPPLYRGADAFLFPSISENAGSYALIDAFALGTPVLSSSTSSMAEICQDAARYFDPRDPEQLGSELAAILVDGNMRTELRRRGLARARKLNSWADIAEKMVAFCEESIRW